MFICIDASSNAASCSTWMPNLIMQTRQQGLHHVVFKTQFHKLILLYQHGCLIHLIKVLLSIKSAWGWCQRLIEQGCVFTNYRGILVWWVSLSAYAVEQVVGLHFMEGLSLIVAGETHWAWWSAIRTILIMVVWNIVVWPYCSSYLELLDLGSKHVSKIFCDFGNRLLHLA